MLGAFGGLLIADGGAVTQALTTTAGKIVAFSGAKGAVSQYDSGTQDGDVGVVPDLTNNRIKVNSPGIYKVEVDLSVTCDATKDLIIGVMKNGVAMADCTARAGVGTARTNIGLTAFVKVAAADNPGTIATMGTPAGTFTGGAGAPKTESYLELTAATVSSTGNITIEAAHFNVTRML